jgi:hypothetical protein
MNVKKIDNIFTQEEVQILIDKLKYLESLPKDSGAVLIDKSLGRLLFPVLEEIPMSIKEKLFYIAESFSFKGLSLAGANAVEYSNKYGIPNLPVHYDHDSNDLIINFQLLSNTKWEVGVDLNLYELEDNSALIFNANEYTHWRPHKIFQDKEFVKMIFFRFRNYNIPSDYSHLQYDINHPIFSEVNKFRDSLKET